MPVRLLPRRCLRIACVLAAAACLLLAATAGAAPNVGGVFPREGPPVVVEDVPAVHHDGSPGPVALMVFGAGVAVAFIVGGYVGAWVARRPLGVSAS